MHGRSADKRQTLVEHQYDEKKKYFGPSLWQILAASAVLLVVVFISVVMILRHDTYHRAGNPHIEIKNDNNENMGAVQPRKSDNISNLRPQIKSQSTQPSLPPGCLSSLPEDHLHKPHITVPPEGPVTLVCCITTTGPLNIAVHRSWAPLGADRFLDMVKTKFFSSRVPLFRALSGFLVQFGLAGDVQVQEQYDTKGNLPDDPSWLPLGPTGRTINGVKRFQKGYLAYAGSGKNSRGTQLILAFEDSEYLGGGSPWEVPWGQLVGAASYETMSKIYTGYGEAPSQGKIRNRGAAYIDAEFPNIDYINSCQVVSEGIPWRHSISISK